MNNEYLTVDQVADKLGVHPKTIRRYISSGRMSAQKIAGSWRISPDALEAYYNSSGNSEGTNQHVSKDDFCIFMDSEYFDTDNKIQICTIVDYYVTDNSVKELLKEVIIIVAENSLESRKNRFNYVYDDTEHKMRLVFWGAPTYMSDIMNVMKKYEQPLKGDIL